MVKMVLRRMIMLLLMMMLLLLLYGLYHGWRYDVRLLGLCSIPFAIALIINPSFLPSSLLLWLVEYIDDDVVGR